MPATKNRYKNVFGKTYKIALADGRVIGNPARLVEQRAENNSRIRFLLAEEESRLREVIARRFPVHLPSFDIALNTGMRKQEQFEMLRALGSHEGRIFQSKYGKALNNPRKWFELALEEAEIKNFRWHDSPYVYQPAGDEGCESANGTGIGWAQDNFDDYAVRSSCARAQSSSFREARSCSSVSVS